MKTMTFTLEKETTGALRYMEVDDNGNPAKDDPLHLVGSLYFRKAGMATALDGSNLWPEILEITVTVKDGAA